MTSDPLDSFIADCRACAAGHGEAADCVAAIAPKMLDLLRGDRAFLKPAHFRSDPDQYARNLIYASDDGDISLYALVWLPGQWTPVHDHGSWGVVGVVEGVLEERNVIRIDDHHDRNSGIGLARGGMILLGEGTVTTFVPNPDHIHLTGVPADRPRAVSLHLYGRMMSSFHIYDVEAGTRRLVDVAHNES